MELISQSSAVIYPKTEDQATEQLRLIEFAGRNCYASQDKITEDSYDKFIRGLLSRGHEAPVEFASMAFDLTTSRAVMAELTRHRLMSFCIESQRYVNYNKKGGLRFIKPEFYGSDETDDSTWRTAMQVAEEAYLALSNNKAPQEAREVLPNSTACRIVVSANLREWRHFFELRCAPTAYPQMQALAKEMLCAAHTVYPCVFGDLYEWFIVPKTQP